MIEVGTSKNSVKVYADLEKGHASTHFADDSRLLDLVSEIIPTVELRDTDIKFEHVFDHVIGECDLQTVQDGDEIVYAVRLRRDRHAKFVKNKSRHQCSSVTIILKQIPDGYELISTWIGHLVPSFPKPHSLPGQDIEEKKYWATHALVWGKQPVDETTITTVCPWVTED